MILLSIQKNMTYKEKIEELETAFAEKSATHSKAFKELSSTNGFGDINALPNFATTKQEFEIAGNEYHNLLCYIRDNNVNIESNYE